MDTGVKDLFLDSLDVVGLSYFKYSQLPTNLKRTALSFDIFKQISEEVQGNPLSDEKFYEKEIYDFSEDDIEVHQRIVHACMALVCLGHDDYIKPLINYLDFPEIRWTVKIDYLLNSLIKPSNEKYKIPTHAQKIEWQNQFINKIFYTKLKDFSYYILLDNNTKFINYFKYSTKISSDATPLHPVLRENYADKIADDFSFSEYYYLRSYQILKEKDYNGFVKFISESVDDSKIPFMNSIARSVADAIYDLEVDKSFNFWKKRLNTQNVNALSSILFYRILTVLNPKQYLAKYFVKTFINDSLDKDLSTCFEKLYRSTTKGEFVRDSCGTLRKQQYYSKQVQSKMEELEPFCIYNIRDYVSNIYSSEKESLVLFSQYHKPGTLKLYKSFKRRFEKNTQILQEISELKNIHLRNISFYSKINVLCNLRIDFRITYLSSDNLKEDIKDDYVKLFSSWIKDTIDENLQQGDQDFIDLL